MDRETSRAGGLPADARFLLSLVGTALLAACGNLTAGGLSETDVTVSGDAPDPVVAGAPVAAPGMPVVNQSEGEEAEGELEAEMFLYLRDAAGDWVPLNQDKIQVKVDVRGVREEGASAALIPSGVYDALRMVFTKIDVEVASGLIVNGQEVVGIVEVELEADSLVVERAVALNLDAGDRVEILVDLNAQSWLFQVDPDVQLVAEQIFANAIDVRVR